MILIAYLNDNWERAASNYEIIVVKYDWFGLMIGYSSIFYYFYGFFYWAICSWTCDYDCWSCYWATCCAGCCWLGWLGWLGWTGGWIGMKMLLILT